MEKSTEFKSFFDELEMVKDDILSKFNSNNTVLDLTSEVIPRHSKCFAPLHNFIHNCRVTLLTQNDLDYEYVPVLGIPKFIELTLDLVLGSKFARRDCAFGIQCIGGRGALRIGAELLKKVLGMTALYISSPAWSEYNVIFEGAGFEVIPYRYWNEKECILDFEGMLQDLEGAKKKSVVLLQASVHNPVGISMSKIQWQTLAKVIRKKNLFIFFDLAYQGLGLSLEEDVWPIRHFAEQGFELLVAQSFSTNFDISDESLGHLTCLTSHPSSISPIRSQFSQIINSNWATPSAFGARLVCKILGDPGLRYQWETALTEVLQHFQDLKHELSLRLNLKDKQRSYFARHNGIYLSLGLNGKKITVMNMVSDSEVSSLNSNGQVLLNSNNCVCLAVLDTINIQVLVSELNKLHNHSTSTSTSLSTSPKNSSYTFPSY